MRINIAKRVPVQAKTLEIYLKVCDEFTAKLVDQDGATLKDYEGYVPGFMPGRHFGDYVDLKIDIDTGKIINWETPTAAAIKRFIEGDDE